MSGTRWLGAAVLATLAFVAGAAGTLHAQTAPAAKVSLEFRIVPEAAKINAARVRELTAALTKAGPAAIDANGPFAWAQVREADERLANLVTATHDGKTYLLVSSEPNDTMLTDRGGAWQILKARLVIDQNNQPAISFELDDDGAARFEALTSTHVGQALAIIVNGEVMSAPIIRATLTNRGMIAGQFSAEWAREVAAALSGAGRSRAAAAAAATAAPRPSASARPAASAAPAPSAAPVAISLADAKRLLDKRVGGTWKEDIHGLFPPSLHVLRGRIDAAPGKALVNYVVFPFGPQDAERQETIGRGYSNIPNARILGANASCTVVEIGDAAAAMTYTRQVTETLGLVALKPRPTPTPSPSPTTAPTPSPAASPTASPFPLPTGRPAKPKDDDPNAPPPKGPRIAIYAVTQDMSLATDAPLDSLTLAATPLLTEDDVDAYDANQNSLLLSAVGIKRLPGMNTVNPHGQPFVMLIDGKRWYLGVLWTPVSSYEQPKVPVSYVGPQAGAIELPVPRFGDAADARVRKRIVAALAAKASATQPASGPAPK